MADPVTEEIVRLLNALPTTYSAPSSLGPAAQRIKELCEQEAARTGEDPFKVLSDCKKIVRNRQLSGWSWLA